MNEHQKFFFVMYDTNFGEEIRIAQEYFSALDNAFSRAVKLTIHGYKNCKVGDIRQPDYIAEF